MNPEPCSRWPSALQWERAGADHNRSGAYQVDFSDKVDRLDVTPDQVRYAIETEDEAAAMDSLILCKFLRGVLTDRFAEMARMVELITGWSIDAAELHAVAQRIVNLRKWYNIRHGWTPTEDTLPQRFLSQAPARWGECGRDFDSRTSRPADRRVQRAARVEPGRVAARRAD